MPPNELRFWEMCHRLMFLTKEQSEALFERMWILDLEQYMKEAKE